LILKFSPEISEAMSGFLNIARTDGPESLLAQEAVGRLHGTLQAEAETRGGEREPWYNAMIVFAYSEALEVNSEYLEMARDASNDLLTVLSNLSDEEYKKLRHMPVIALAIGKKM